MFYRKTKKIMAQIDEISTLKCKINELNRHIESLKHLEKSNKELVKVNEELVARTNKVEKQVRLQTEADLFFTSAKIQDELLHGKKKEEIKPLVTSQNLYLERMAALQQQQATPYNSFGLGALGKGGIWIVNYLPV